MNILWLLSLVSGVTATREETFPKGLIQPKKPNQHFDFTFARNSSLKNISLEKLTLLRFVSDLASWSRWETVVFFFPNSSEFPYEYSPLIYNYFNAEGKFVSIYTTSHPLLPQSVLHYRHHLGIVYICDFIDENFLDKVSDLDLLDSYRTWVIMQMNPTRSNLKEVLRNLNIGLVTNLIVATLERRQIPTSTPLMSITTTTTTFEFLVGFKKRQIQNDLCSERHKRDLARDANLLVHLEQIHKASETENETLSTNLGFWDMPNGMLKAKTLVSPEARRDLGGHKISVGVKNSTRDAVGNLPIDRFSFDSEADEETRFLELFDCLMFGMNASFEIQQFQKLGWRNEEGGWTHLLGAVVDGNVDFALETINPNADKMQDMMFTYAIVITMNNIYFRRPKSTGLRDIFMAPFSPRLLLCVFGTTVLLTLAMISINMVNYHREQKKASSEYRIFTRGKKQRTVVVKNREERRWELSEAALWSVSVMCMQGSQWSPKCVSGSLLLINSLMFALIIYNSFAAFITSVLSVKDAKIKNLKDLAKSDFAFGYTLGDADELFLRTVNDTLLRELYFKGLRENDGVTKPIEGMQRASKGKYGFFVAARTARRALQTVIAHDKRCEFQELYLPATKTYASIPVTKKSSLKKILNYKIINLMETGILERFQGLILPSMPRCVEKTTFNSAKLTDVYSAFFVLLVGWITSIFILFSEILWYRRKKMKAKAFKRNFKYESFRTAGEFYWLK